MLIIRLEDLESCAGKAFEKFLGIPDIKLKKSNFGDEKWYKDIYLEFISKIVLPEDTLMKCTIQNLCVIFILRKK